MVKKVKKKKRKSKSKSKPKRKSKAKRQSKSKGKKLSVKPKGQLKPGQKACIKLKFEWGTRFQAVKVKANGQYLFIKGNCPNPLRRKK